MRERTVVLEVIIEKLGLEILSGGDGIKNEVTGVHISDLLSEVIANAEAGELWITLQVHPNIIAVATLKELSGIILTTARQPEEETVKRAGEEHIPLMATMLPTFQLAGKLYKLIGEC
jgi:predicted transcriptional regulator